MKTICYNMKKLLLLLCLLLCSCGTPSFYDEGTVVEVYMCSLKDARYEIRVNCRTLGYGKKYVHFYTNTLYQVGDTIKIVKR